MTLYAPLFDKIAKYDGIRFHMPAHNGEMLSPLYASAAWDISELRFSDNLLFANGVIREAEALAAAAYKVKYTRFFTAGGTSAILTAIYTIKEKCGKALVLGAAHASVFNGLRLFNIPYTMSDKLDADSLRGIDAVITTSPDVYGRTKDIKAIRAVVGERLLIVDEAHGAHYAFSELLPPSATRYADIVMNSMHKTLPVYTGGAVLHTNSAALDKAVCSARRMVHTSSPSYLVMASMDYARAVFLRDGESLYKSVADSIAALKLPDGYSLLKNDDFSRMVIKTGGRGREVSAALEKAKIYAEMHDNDSVVLIITPYNCRHLITLETFLCNERIEAAPTFSDTMYKELIGSIAPRDIGLFPPCVPIIQRGEIITAEKLNIVLASADRAYGLDDEN